MLSRLTSLSCSASRSLRDSLTSSISIRRWVNCELADEEEGKELGGYLGAYHIQAMETLGSVKEELQQIRAKYEGKKQEDQ